MSWHFSQAMVAVYGGLSLLDTESCARLKSIRMTERALCDVRRKDTSPPSLFGTTSEPSMAAHAVEAWMSLLRDSRANPSPSRGNDADLTMSATFGPRHIESSGRSIPDTSCSKMCPGYDHICPWSSETCAELAIPLKSPGLLPPPPWVRDILESASGYLPTTKASASGPDYARSSRPHSGGDDLTTVLHKHYLLTTTACDSGTNRGGGKKQTGKPRPPVRTLLRRSYLPTTTVNGNNNRTGLSEKSGDGIGTILRERRILTGTPNPDWLDWYVGLPIGASGLEPLATSRFRRWLDSHGKY